MSTEKELTSMQELIDFIKSQNVKLISSEYEEGYIDALSFMEEKIKSLLPKQKAQIVDAWYNGSNQRVLDIELTFENGEDYFNSKYKQ